MHSSPRLLSVLVVALATTLIGTANTAAAEPDIVGWRVAWDAEAGDTSLRRSADIMGGTSPFSYTLNRKGRIVRSSGAVPRADAATSRELGLQVLPTIGNEFDGARVGRILKTASRRRAHAVAITRLVRKNRYDGIDIDYENLRMKDRRRFVAFLHELSRRLHRNGKVLSVAIQARTATSASSGARATNYRGIGRAADQVRIMGYDYHWAGGRPGPIAPKRWVRDVLDYAVKYIPRRKLYLGVPMYGYHWVSGAARPAKSVTWRSGMRLARRTKSRIRWSARTGSHWFRFRRRGKVHTVWFETPQASRIKGQLAGDAGIAGIAIWRLGSEHPQAIANLHRGYMNASGQ